MEEEKERVLGGFYIFKRTTDGPLITGIVVFKRVPVKFSQAESVTFKDAFRSALNNTKNVTFKNVFFYSPLPDLNNLHSVNGSPLIPNVSKIKQLIETDQIKQDDRLYECTVQNLVEFFSKCFAPPLSPTDLTELTKDVNEMLYSDLYDPSIAYTPPDPQMNVQPINTNIGQNITPSNTGTGTGSAIIPNNKSTISSNAIDTSLALGPGPVPGLGLGAKGLTSVPPRLTQTTSPGLTQTTSPGLTQTTSPGLRQTTSPGLTQTTSPGLTQTTSPLAPPPVLEVGLTSLALGSQSSVEKNVSGLHDSGSITTGVDSGASSIATQDNRLQDADSRSIKTSVADNASSVESGLDGSSVSYK